MGQTRSSRLIQLLAVNGIGECTIRGELPPRRMPWFYDNGAFVDHSSRRPFAATKFEADIDRIRSRDVPPPDFVLLPDLVAGGLESLRISMSWMEKLFGVAPLFLALQDGMSAADVVPHLAGVDGLFVGGSVPWKVATGCDWVNLARSHGKPCHIGRVGTIRRVEWARRIGADSIDSSFPLWTIERLESFMRALSATLPPELPFGDVNHAA